MDTIENKLVNRMGHLSREILTVQNGVENYIKANWQREHLRQLKIEILFEAEPDVLDGVVNEVLKTNDLQMFLVVDASQAYYNELQNFSTIASSPDKVGKCIECAKLICAGELRYYANKINNIDVVRCKASYYNELQRTLNTCSNANAGNDDDEEDSDK